MIIPHRWDQKLIRRRTYYKKAVEIYEHLPLGERQKGRALYYLGRLLHKHGFAEGSVLVSRAGEIFKRLTNSDMPLEQQDPFEYLIHPYDR